VEKKKPKWSLSSGVELPVEKGVIALQAYCSGCTMTVNQTSIKEYYMVAKDDFVAESNTNISTASESSECSVSDTPLARSLAAYLVDLPKLLANHKRKWVVYADGQQLRFGSSQAELYHHCLQDLGLTHDRFIIRRIMPESSPQIEHNLRGNY
jgi:hypothetical protein